MSSTINNENYPFALPEGTVLNGCYIVGNVLGQGGFGITYVARNYNTKELVAIKEYFPDTMAIRTDTYTVSAYNGQKAEHFQYGKECFLAEAKTLAEFIGSPNIVRVHCYFEENGTAYFVMDYVEGESFEKYLEDRGERLSCKEAEKILFPVMDALTQVHEKGIIHRDISPDNIFITKDGTVKLLDFGSARYSLGNQSHSLDVVLKHGFSPKEQYTRRGKQGPYTDVYSMGATLYYAITLKLPPDSIDRFDEDDLILPSSIGAEITPEEEDTVLKALAVQPAERYQTMEAFKLALINASKDENTDSVIEDKDDDKDDDTDILIPSEDDVLSHDKKKGKWLVAAVGVIIVAAALGLGGRKVPGDKDIQTSGTAPIEKNTETISLVQKNLDYSNTGDITEQHEYEYDSMGHKIKETFCGDTGEVVYCCEYEYDSMGHEIKETFFNDTGKVNYCYEYEYDSMGHLIKYTGFDRTGKVDSCGEYEYDSMGHKIKETFFDDTGKVDFCYEYEYEYDSMGHKIKETCFDDTGKVKYCYEYDSMGHRIKCTGFDGTGKVKYCYEYEYDSSGNIVQEEEYDAMGNLQEKTVYENSYDQDKNLIGVKRYVDEVLVEEYIYIVMEIPISETK